LKGRDHWGDLGIDGRILLTCTAKKWCDMNWIEVAQARVQLQASVNKVVNLWLRKLAKFLISSA
jgi:hypothetical protein